MKNKLISALNFKGKTMKKIIAVLFTLIIMGCEDNNNEDTNQSLVFISNEGNFGSSNGSISVFQGKSKIQ